MRNSRKRLGRRALVATCSLVALLSVAGYAYTASNTVPNATLGQGSNTISGYTVSSVAYNLNAGNPSNLDSVSFTISPAAATSVKVQLAPAGTWYSCTNTTGSVSCATTSPQATAAAATALNVVASQ
ncbi:MAG TPA: hypothetical protein VGN27_01220 [Gaiellaceae bacterium]|jgi:hypothetical protein|nr:hypothetical protein [Gaiellaceae bacterium]